MKLKRKQLIGIIILMVLPLFFLALSVDAQPLNYRAHLSGDEEVPDPVDTQAQGQVKFQLSSDGTELYYRLIVANIENVMMAHIHMAFAGENGPVIAWLYPSPTATMGELIPGRFDGVLVEGIITDEDVQFIEGGLEALIVRFDIEKAYVNVHTEQNPAGEIRGQIK